MAVVKNEITVGNLTNKYNQTKGQLEDLIDSWTQNLRRKKKTTRKTVKVRTHAQECCGAGQSGSVARAAVIAY